MKKLTRNNIIEIWKMRNLTVKEFFASLAKHSELNFFMTVVGCWWLIRLVVGLTMGVNVIYYICRVFKLVLG